MHDAFNRMLPQQIAKDRRLHNTAKAIHSLMRFHPKTTVQGVATTMGISTETARRHIKQLCKYDWMYSFRRPGDTRVLYAPWMPLDLEIALAEHAEWIYSNIANRGEWLMRSVIYIIVDDVDFIDNTRLQSIISSVSGHRLEFDQYFFKAKLAVEFQGRQHFEEVVFRNGKSDLREQQQRDGLKLLACRRQGITLIEMADIDLSPSALTAKLKPHMPLVTPRTERPLYQLLTRLCDGYAEWALAQRNEI